jgi:hypothetical protein
MLLDRTRVHLRWGALLELRNGRCVIVFVGYEGATEEPRRRVEAALDAAAGEVGVEWTAYFDVSAR